MNAYKVKYVESGTLHIKSIIVLARCEFQAEELVTWTLRIGSGFDATKIN